jgi:DNA polymerase bacteriophage-type
MSILFWDFETRSIIPIDVGAWRYADDPSTEALCVAYAFDDGEPKVWEPGQPVPNEIIEAANDPNTLVVAHNAEFERAVLTRILHPKHGWPLIALERQRCSAAVARASALPGGLDAAAKVLGLPGKDAEGTKLMRLMSKPRKPRKGEDRNVIYWVDDPEKRAQLQLYCMQDVRVERDLYRRLPPLSAAEQKVWELDAQINARGFYVDVALATAARDVVLAEKAAIKAEVSAVTNGNITSIDQIEKITALAGVKSLNKKAGHVEKALQGDLDPVVRRVLELRQAGAAASSLKALALLESVDTDNRVRGGFIFHGAVATGRWTGSGLQPQNLKKPTTKDLDSAAAAVLAGNMSLIRELGAPLSVVGDLSRSMICAAPGYILTGADFSSIESRVLAWLAGEEWKLEDYRQFDLTGDPRLEPYCVTATRVLGRNDPVTPDDEAARGIGKLCDLAFGFAGGVGAWRKFDPDKKYSDEEAERFKNEWRREHPNIVRFWNKLSGAQASRS